MNNPTVVFPAAKTVAIEDASVPKPGDSDVVIRTSITLVSIGTELSILNGEYPAGSGWERYGKFPFNPGYNNIGTVVDVGSSVDKSFVGKRVATYGKHAAYITSAASSLRMVPDGVSDEEAVFFTIAEIVMNGVRRSQVTWGEAATVFGLGLLGQFAARFASLAGADVFASDISDYRLSLLPKPVVTVNAAKEKLMDVVAAKTKSRMCDVAFEVTGDPDLIPGEFAMLRRQGRFVVLSSPRGKTSFDFHDLCNAPSFTIIGAHNGSHPSVASGENPWTQLRHAELYFDLVAEKRIDVKPLITRTVPYTEAPKEYASLIRDRSSVMGILFDWKKI
mgnify:CR=1 FL=1